MQIVIELSDRALEFIKENGIKDIYGIEEAICNGVVLPKGHGRLVDADAITKNIQSFNDSFVINTARGGYSSIWCIAPTIIEADKEVDE